MWSFLSQGHASNLCSVREPAEVSDENRHVLSLLHLVQEGVTHLKDKLATEINERNEEEAALWRAMHTIQTQTAQQFDELRFWRQELSSEMSASFEKLEKQLQSLQAELDKTPSTPEGQAAWKSRANNWTDLLQAEVAALKKFQEQAIEAQQELKAEMETLARRVVFTSEPAEDPKTRQSAYSELFKDDFSKQVASLQKEVNVEREARAGEIDRISKELENVKAVLNNGSKMTGSATPSPLRVMQDNITKELEAQHNITSDELLAELGAFKDMLEQIMEGYEELKADVGRLSAGGHELKHKEVNEISEKLAALQDAVDENRQVHAHFHWGGLTSTSAQESAVEGEPKSATTVEVRELSEVLKAEVAAFKNFQIEALSADKEMKKDLEALSAKLDSKIGSSTDIVSTQAEDGRFDKAIAELREEVKICLADFCLASSHEYDKAAAKVFHVNGNGESDSKASTKHLSPAGIADITSAVAEAVQECTAANRECENLQNTITNLSTSLHKTDSNGFSEAHEELRKELQKIEREIEDLRSGSKHDLSPSQVSLDEHSQQAFRSFQSRTIEAQEQLKEEIKILTTDFTTKLSQVEEIARQGQTMAIESFAGRFASIQKEVNTDRDAFRKALDEIKINAPMPDGFETVRAELDTLKIFVTDKDIREESHADIVPLENQLEELAQLIEEARIDACNKVSDLEKRLSTVVVELKTAENSQRECSDAMSDITLQVSELKRRASLRRQSGVRNETQRRSDEENQPLNSFPEDSAKPSQDSSTQGDLPSAAMGSSKHEERHLEHSDGLMIGHQPTSPARLDFPGQRQASIMEATFSATPSMGGRKKTRPRFSVSDFLADEPS